MKILIQIVLSLMVINFIISKKINIFNNTDYIEFARISEYVINIKENKNLTNENILENSYLSIEIGVDIGKDCVVEQHV